MNGRASGKAPKVVWSQNSAGPQIPCQQAVLRGSNWARPIHGLADGSSPGVELARRSAHEESWQQPSGTGFRKQHKASFFKYLLVHASRSLAVSEQAVSYWPSDSESGRRRTRLGRRNCPSRPSFVRTLCGHQTPWSGTAWPALPSSRKSSPRLTTTLCPTGNEEAQ